MEPVLVDNLRDKTTLVSRIRIIKNSTDFIQRDIQARASSHSTLLYFHRERTKTKLRRRKVKKRKKEKFEICRQVRAS